MHDIRAIRMNPETLQAAMLRRNKPAEAEKVHSIVSLDADYRRLLTEKENLLARRNAASKEIGQAMAGKDSAKAEALKAEVAAGKDRLVALETETGTLEAQIQALLAGIPNIPHADVPEGADEHGNMLYRDFGQKPALKVSNPKEHFELGEKLGMMDFETAATLSGSRFVVLQQGLARLERALGQFMLDLHTADHGYTEVNPPILVRDDAMFGTAQLPKFRDDQFRAGEEHWLIPTAEVPLTNLVREKILAEEELPLRFTALTPCFRAEAGSAGRDTRGMLRQHQFNKVELVSITTPEKSADEHERMLASAEAVLKKLDLHHRVMTLCTGDMGFASQKTYDIEVWLPGQNTYREISSCSVCGDFQAMRMNARFRPAGEKGTRFVHTLNGSGVAVGRCLIAVMENYQNEDGSITVPAALLPYMGGVTKIEKAT
jgi:seryl-tRNA synthetase